MDQYRSQDDYHFTMIQDRTAIFRSALRMSPGDRATLARQLVDSLAESTPSSIDAAWVAEAERRLTAFERGKNPGIKGSQVQKALRAGRKP